MGPFSTNSLAVATANAGALGIVSAGGYFLIDSLSDTILPELRKQLTGGREGTPIEHIKHALHQTAAETKYSGGIFGLNLMVVAGTDKLVSDVVKTVAAAKKEDPELAARFRVMITSAGDPLPWTDAIKSMGVKWFHVVPSVKHALRAEKAGVDLIIASGHEGGMHIAWEPVHSMVLLPAVVKAVKTPVVGAGGFGDGLTLAAALVMGAAGIQMGTRFLATKDSETCQMHKDQIVESVDRGTTVARGYAGPARFLKSQASMKLTELTIAKAPALFLGQPVATGDDILDKENEGFEALLTSDKPKALMPGGEVAGRIDDLPTVKELVERTVAEAEAAIHALPGKLVGG